MQEILSSNILITSLLIILALIFLDVITKVAVSVFNGEFDWNKLLLFLRTNIFPYVIVFGGVEGILFASKYLPDVSASISPLITTMTTVAAATYALILARLVKSIYDNLKEIGVPVPEETETTTDY
jgi:phage-related holin